MTCAKVTRPIPILLSSGSERSSPTKCCSQLVGPHVKLGVLPGSLNAKVPPKSPAPIRSREQPWGMPLVSPKEKVDFRKCSPQGHSYVLICCSSYSSVMEHPAIANWVPEAPSVGFCSSSSFYSLCLELFRITWTSACYAPPPANPPPFLLAVNLPPLRTALPPCPIKADATTLACPKCMLAKCSKARTNLDVFSPRQLNSIGFPDVCSWRELVTTTWPCT